MALALGSFTGYTTYQGAGSGQAQSDREWLPGGVAMPHKYEREIEEILRNLEGPESNQGLGERIRPFKRPAARRPRGPHGPRVSWVPRLELSVTLMLVGIALALVGAGLTYYQLEATLVSGLIALGGFLLFAVGVALGWWARFRGVSAPARRVRRSPSSDNVVRIRPVRSNPLSRLTTSLRMRQMRRRYRNTTDR
ncbi:MAG TPA: hypothetical protein VJO13_01055 [Ktedonobacterales bacterium]|nr:hypothetical protein [Ktedonobacterales bacterium]